MEGAATSSERTKERKALRGKEFNRGGGSSKKDWKRNIIDSMLPAVKKAAALVRGGVEKGSSIVQRERPIL